MLKNISFLFLFNFALFGQDFSITSITSLEDGVAESSGLLFVDGRIVTHNDSGDGPFLYEIDEATGEITRKVTVSNAGSTDWEDLCKDENYIYIGDFGNNWGTRTDLAIYRIAIDDYLTTVNDTILCDTILFSYTDQITFEPTTYSTNYDAEAIIAYNDSLYLFSKNWGNSKTNIYSIPKIPGTYSVNKVDSLNVEGLITSASFDPIENEILLTGYTISYPFVYFIKGIEGNSFSAANYLKRSAPSIAGSNQIEGSCSLGEHLFYISSENAVSGTGTLNKVNVYNFTNLPAIDTHKNQLIFPNPSSDFIYLQNEDYTSYSVIDNTGKLIESGTVTDRITITDLSQGSYILQLYQARRLVERYTFVKK